MAEEIAHEKSSRRYLSVKVKKNTKNYLRHYQVALYSEKDDEKAAEAQITQELHLKDLG